MINLYALSKLFQGNGLERLTRVLALGATMAFGGSVSAATVIEASSMDGGTQILGLDVNGVLYDVHFESQNAAAFYTGPSSPGFDFTNEGTANMARDAVNAALNAAGVTSISRINSISQANNFIVPYLMGGNTLNGSQGMYDSVNGWHAVFANGINNSIVLTSVVNIALFTPTPVPLPGGLALMLSGLTILAVRRRSAGMRHR